MRPDAETVYVVEGCSGTVGLKVTMAPVESTARLPAIGLPPAVTEMAPGEPAKSTGRVNARRRAAVTGTFKLPSGGDAASSCAGLGSALAPTVTGNENVFSLPAVRSKGSET